MPKLKKKTSKSQGLSTYKLRTSPVLKSSSLNTWDKLRAEFGSNQSYVNLILGLLIILVAGVLVFNYLKKTQSTLGPSQQTTAEESTADVTPENLPGKYTVKEGDTLFSIALAYYKDGFKFNKISESNKLLSADIIEVGQVLDIPKIEENSEDSALGTGGATNSTIWGDKIEGDSYTVVEGDWLSTIAGRAYGDVMAFDKIAKANNVSNPDVIEPGTTLKIPR